MTNILIQSVAIGITSLDFLCMGLRAFPDNLVKARTIAFSTLIVAELLRAYSSRSERHILLFEIGIFSNPTMIYATTFPPSVFISSYIYTSFTANILYCIFKLN